MRVLVASERLSSGSDDGIKNIALAFVRELRARGHEVKGLSEWQDIPDEGVERFAANRLYLAPALARTVRRFRPERILYVPWTSATARALFRLRALAAYAGGAATAIVATQPMPLGRLGRSVARALGPDLAFVQCAETRRILEGAGIATAFLPSGHDPARFRPAAPSDSTDPRGALGLDRDRPVLLHVGHLRRERIDVAMIAALRAALPDLQIVVVASPHTPQDDALAADLVALRTKLVRAFVPDIGRVYRAADVYLFPVRRRFACVGVPLSVIEAMACDLPVVSTPFGGLPDLFDGAPGVRFASDEDGIAAAVADALRAGPQAGTRRLVKDLTWGRIVDEAMADWDAGPRREILRARQLLSLLRDDPAAGPPPPSLPSREIREQLAGNKVPLMEIDPPEGAAALRAARGDAERSLESSLAEYLACRRVLEPAGIDTLFTKSAGPFPYESDNMDLLVDPARAAEAARLLRPAGYLPMAHYREDHKWILKRFDGAAVANILHFHHQVSWGVEPFLDVDDLWRRSRRSPDEPRILVPSREDAFLTVIAHALYENDRIKLGDLWKVRRLLRGDGFDWGRCRAAARSLGWEAGLDLALVLFAHCEAALWERTLIPAAEREAALRRLGGADRRFARRVTRRPLGFPLPLSRPFTKALFYRKILHNPRSGPVMKLRRALGATRDNVEAVLGVNHQRPFLVSLSGIDGSGKSALVAALSAALHGAEVRHRVVWVRGGNSAGMQAANRLFRWLAGTRVRRVLHDGTDPGGEARIVSPFLRALWPWVVAVEQAALYLTRVRLPLWRRRVVILDRGLIDTLVDLRVRCGDPKVEERLPLRLLAAVAGRPAVAWHLRVDPDAAHRRKRDDFSPETLRARAAHYDELAAKLGLVRLSTDGPLADARRRLVDETLGRYFDGYERARR